MPFRKIKFSKTPKQHRTSDGGIKLRDEFPFLADADCPIELQALVTRRISSYHEYQNKWFQLLQCATLEDCAKIAGEVVNSYLDNRKIYDELNYYQKYHKVYGHHRIFQEFSQAKKLRTMSIKDLLRRQYQVENNIWRVKNEMAKKNKPELDDVRRDRLKTYENELIEINRLLDE